MPQKLYVFVIIVSILGGKPRFIADGESFERDAETPRIPEGDASNVEFLKSLLHTEHFKWKSEKDGIFQLLDVDKASDLLSAKKISLKDELSNACKNENLIQHKDEEHTYTLGPKAKEFLQK